LTAAGIAAVSLRELISEPGALRAEPGLSGLAPRQPIRQVGEGPSAGMKVAMKSPAWRRSGCERLKPIAGDETLEFRRNGMPKKRTRKRKSTQ